MRVGEVEPEDVEELIKLMKQYFSFYDVNPPEDCDIKKLILELYQEDNPSVQFNCKIGSQLIGFVTLYEVYSTLSAGKVILMNDLYVVEEYRGTEAATLLFNKAVSYTRENGYPKMEWMTEPENTRAINFYNKMGGKSSPWVYYSIT